MQTVSYGDNLHKMLHPFLLGWGGGGLLSAEFAQRVVKVKTFQKKKRTRKEQTVIMSKD